MPRREDLKSVLVIGSGPIVIGQGCEFDYSGTQACRVLKQEGIRVSLVNSNPATIMTDPEFADATYVEPITTETLEKVIAIQRPDAVLPTLGGQTALNAAVALHDSGILRRYNVELIGANIDAIRAGEDRERFKEIVTGLGAEVPVSRICRSLDECLAAITGQGGLGYPVVVRPSFTMGGLGSGFGLGRRVGGGYQAAQRGPALAPGREQGHPARGARAGAAAAADPEVGAKQRPDPRVGAGLDVLERAVEAVAVGQRECGHAEAGRPGGQRTGSRGAVAQRERGRDVQVRELRGPRH